MPSDYYRSEPVRLEPVTDPSGVAVIDDIQGVRVPFVTPESVVPSPNASMEFCFPTDVSYDLDTTSLRIPTPVNVCVRDRAGRVVVDVPHHASETLSFDQYTVEIGGLGVKVYLSVRSGLRIPPATEGTRTITAVDAERICLGVRSLHNRPATTVTTTDDPTDVMRALSCFGSALKTTSCERSFPTLRGHPPQIERGSRFAAPPALERTPAETDIHIELPPTFEHIYPAASLAYYLAAPIVSGDRPRLVVDGTAHSLEHPDGYDRAVARLLEHVFTLDCLTRTEGFYPVRLAERERIEDAIDLDFAALYDQPLAEQVATYLTVPFETVAPIVPRWPLTTTVAPTEANIEILPYVVADLSCIRTPRTETATEPAVDAYHDPLNEFLRSSSMSGEQRSARGSFELDTEWVHTQTPQSTESITHLWFDDGYPIAGAKPTLDACQRRLAATSSGPIDVAVLSNAPEMHAETDVAELYGMRDLIAFDVTVFEERKRTAVREILTTEYDLVHYIGHVTDDGLQCADGWLDAATLDRVGTRSFILNGCRSVGQGMALVEAGAIGGLCTLRDVANTPATNVGRTVARLLNAGFSLGGALDLITDFSVTGHQYMVVGDPRLTIATCKGMTALLLEVHSQGPEQYEATVFGRPVASAQLGSLCMPFLGAEETYTLNSGRILSKAVTRTELQTLLDRDRFPVRLDGELTWSDRITDDMLSATTTSCEQ